VTVSSRKELAKAIRDATPQTLFYHFFEDAFRKGTRNGSLIQWVAEDLRDQKLAEDLSNFNPYRLHMNRLRTDLVSLISGPKEGARDKHG
jgi:hypothetical protein